MKNSFVSSFVLSVLIISSSVSAELYKGVDSQGNVIYSDKPFEDAEKYTPPPISVMDKPKAKTDGKVIEEKKPVEFKYLSFDITSPVNNQTIRNEPDVSVSLSLKPGLNVAEGHSIWLLLNGKPVVKNTQNLSMKVGRLDRGANKLQAQVRNKQGKIIVRTRTTAVFIHQTSAY